MKSADSFIESTLSSCFLTGSTFGSINLSDCYAVSVNPIRTLIPIMLLWDLKNIKLLL